MQETSVTDTRVSDGAILDAARELAAALAETPEYQAFDAAERQMRGDEAAQGAIRAFKEKQRSLGWQSQFGLVSDSERQELGRLQEAMLAQPAVRAYAEAQERLSSLCREVAGLISETIGLNLAACCGPGCACRC